MLPYIKKASVWRLTDALGSNACTEFSASMVSGSCTQYDIRIVQLKMAVQGLVRGHAFIVPRRNQASGEPTRGDSGSNPDTCPCFHVEYHTARSSGGSAITSEGVQAYQNKPTGSGVRGGISLERSMELCIAKFSSQAVGVGSHTKGNPLSS